MKSDKRVIWSDMDLDLEEYDEYFDEVFPDATEDRKYEMMYELLRDYLDDERENLNIQLSNPILVIGDVGRWDGRYSGYMIIKSGNIRDCLSSSMDSCEWYVDGLGDLRMTGCHHDGTNYYLYREIKPEVSSEALENFLYKIYKGVATRADITRMTTRLGDYIGDVYGWTFPKYGRKKAA